MTADGTSSAASVASEPGFESALVARDQCRGSDLCCANCGVPLGGRHKVLCHAYAKALTAERRASEPPSPYFEGDGITLYHGDCLTIAAWLTADVLVTDPPYGTQFSAENPKGGYGRRQNAGLGPEGFTIANDGTTETRDAALALWGNRPALVFGSPRLPDPPIAVADRLVWDKKRPGMNGGPWRYRHESIYVTAGFERTSDAAVSVLTAFPEQSEHIHAKPLSLMLALVLAAPPGVIADPFAGSGTTLVAARNAGRRAIGCEVEERYCELLATRLQQGDLFGETA